MKLPRPIHLLLLAPLFLANCRSTGGGSGSSTPSTSMSPSEYPFDENGNYREDWVKGGASTSSVASNSTSSDVVDLTKDNPPSPFLGTTDPRDSYTPPKKSTSSSYTKSKTSSKSTAKAKTKPKAKPAPKATYVTVKKGDTLYGLAKRYGTSVKAIQSANGMGSKTVLQNGKSLKIPR